MNTYWTNQPPSPRAGTIPSREMVNVFAESIAKANIFPRVQPIDFNVGSSTANRGPHTTAQSGA